MGIHFSIYFAGKAHATRCSNSNPSLPRLAGEGSDGGGF
ncbi:superoxide dismutase [Neisseria mucosa]|nr:superoxide dismutase [Neisseria mucosa]